MSTGGTGRYRPGGQARRLGAVLVVLVVLAGCTSAPPTPPGPSGGIQSEPTAASPQPAATATAPAATPMPGPPRTPRPTPIPATNVSIDINGRHTHTTTTPRKVVDVLVIDVPIDVVVHYPGSLNGRETSVDIVQPYSVRWPIQLSLAEDPNTVAFQLTGEQPGFFTVAVSAEGYAPVRFSIRAVVPPTPGPGTPQEGTPGAGPPAAATPLPATVGPVEVSTAAPSLGPAIGTALPGAGSPGSPTPAAAGGTQTVTLADAGGTVTLRAGERFVLALGEGYDWQVTVADPAVASRVVNITPVRGSQGVYEAHKPGQTALTADGEPTCRKVQPPCMLPSRLFDVQVVVQ